MSYSDVRAKYSVETDFPHLGAYLFKTLLNKHHPEYYPYVVKDGQTFIDKDGQPVIDDKLYVEQFTHWYLSEHAFSTEISENRRLIPKMLPKLFGTKTERANPTTIHTVLYGGKRNDGKRNDGKRNDGKRRSKRLIKNSSKRRNTPFLNELKCNGSMRICQDLRNAQRCKRSLKTKNKKQIAH